MPAPRVLPKEHAPAPRLALVDNIDVAGDIIDVAIEQNAEVVEALSAPPLPAGANAGKRYKRHLRLAGKGRNGDVEIRRYAGPCHPTALTVAKQIQARHGGHLHVTGPCTVAVRNYPPERNR